MTYKPNKENPKWEYLTFIHDDGERHFIGRVRSEAEFIGEMNKPETKSEFEQTLKNMAKEINQLIIEYSKARSGSVERIVKSLRIILAKYGY